MSKFFFRIISYILKLFISEIARLISRMPDTLQDDVSSKYSFKRVYGRGLLIMVIGLSGVQFGV